MEKSGIIVYQREDEWQGLDCLIIAKGYIIESEGWYICNVIRHYIGSWCISEPRVEVLWSKDLEDLKKIVDRNCNHEEDTNQ